METKASTLEILTVNEAANYLRISPWTLRHWISQGKVIYLKYLDGAVRIRRSDLDKFVVQNLRGNRRRLCHEDQKTE